MTKSRAYIFTLNNYTSEDEVYIQTVLQCQYIVYGREVAPQTGTPHLQGYVYFANPRSFESVRKLRKWSIQVAKADALKNAEYTKKSDDWFEKGDRPLTQKEKGDCERDRYKRAFQFAMEGDYLAIDSDILLRHYGTLKKIRAEFTKVSDLDFMPLCIYLHGKTGVGKSRLARELSGTGCFRKEPMTKWFTGYAHQKVVWIDELEPMSHELQSLYKRLCDHYVCPVESKGGNMDIRPEIIIFTSNHPPGRVFGDATEPMLRRLNVFELTHENASEVQARCKELVQARSGPCAASSSSEGMDCQEANVHSSSEEDVTHGDGTSSEGHGET